MKRIFLLISFLLIYLISCKKDSATLTLNKSATSITPAPDGTASTATTTAFYGFFTSRTFTTVTLSNSIIATTSARAYFSSNSIQYGNITNKVQVNGVYRNGDSLSYSTLNKNYTLTSNVNLSTETWSVNGANGIASFSYENNLLTPLCSGLESLPDSVNRNVGLSANVYVNNISSPNITAEFTVHDGVINFISKTLQLGSNSINISPNDLMLLNSSNIAYIEVGLYNYKGVIFGGKDYRFTRETVYRKYIKIY